MVVYLYLWGKTINKLATDRKKIMLNKKGIYSWKYNSTRNRFTLKMLRASAWNVQSVIKTVLKIIKTMTITGTWYFSLPSTVLTLSTWQKMITYHFERYMNLCYWKVLGLRTYFFNLFLCFLGGWDFLTRWKIWSARWFRKMGMQLNPMEQVLYLSYSLPYLRLTCMDEAFWYTNKL